ncbi:MAG: molybdopterin dinucleotide binding domain-containing protein, partial [Pseudomonadota bacterium]
SGWSAVGGQTRNPHGIDLGPLAPRVPEVILTASGKIDLAPTPLLEDMKRMSTLAPPVDGLMLIGRRHMKSNNSWMHNDDELLRGNFCTLLLHPSDAADRGLRSGDLARVRNIAGELEVPVEVTAAIMPGVVSIPHGWGHSDPFIRLGRASASPGVNVNALVSDELVDPLTGNAAFSNVRVEVSAVDRAGAAMRGRDAGG